MSYLHDKHEAILAYSLESTKYFGDPITFTSPESTPLHSYDVNGKITQNTEEHSEDNKGVVALFSRVVARYSTLATLAGKGTDPNWKDNMPAAGWSVTFTNRRTGVVEDHVLEPGSIRPDYELGVVHYVLAQMETVTP